MSGPAHTPGPLRVGGTDRSHVRFSKQDIHSPGSTDTQQPIAVVVGIDYRDGEPNARLLAAAYNAFDSAARELNVNAVELAERMSTCGIADLAECLRDILSRFLSCIAQGNGEIEGDREAISKADAALAKVLGGAA